MRFLVIALTALTLAGCSGGVSAPQADDKALRAEMSKPSTAPPEVLEKIKKMNASMGKGPGSK